MRLNFSGVDEAAIREGVRRIGEVVRDQVALYGTLTGSAPAAPAAEPRPADPDPELAEVLHLPEREGRGRGERGAR
jgi:2-aminoadipate transaminase